MTGFNERSFVPGAVDPAEFNLNMPQRDGQQSLTFDESDLSIFNNADLINFDWDDSLQSATFKPDSSHSSNLPMDFGNEFGFGFDPSVADAQNAPHFQQSSVGPYPQHNSSMNSNLTSHSSSPVTGSNGLPQSNAANAQKRARESSTAESPAENFGADEVARRAADEDKRRRNTAASARFRVKKKQREQAMEQTAKDMGEKVKQLETRVNTLEAENKFLRDLITEKEGKAVDFESLRSTKKDAVKEESKTAST